MSTSGSAYDAFISYSHAADGRLAPAVQTGLQRLARPWYRRWALRVFRDDTGLSVDPQLWGSIARALDESAWFLLMASPEAAASPWVNREIEYWCEHRDASASCLSLPTACWFGPLRARTTTRHSRRLCRPHSSDGLRRNPGISIFVGRATRLNSTSGIRASDKP